MAELSEADAAKVQEAIRRIVASAPPLLPETKAELARLLAPGKGEE